MKRLALSLRDLKKSLPAFLLSSSLVARLTASRKRFASFSVSRTERQPALAYLVHAIKEYRELSESKPLTLQGSEFARAVQELDAAIERAERLMQA